MKIKHTEVVGYETDDVIASYAIKYGEDIPCVISSWDSDYFQLINESVNVLRYRGKTTMVCDVDFIQNKFGIIPEVYADFKSLTGDKADNIKGAEKVGVKTAAKLLNQFGNLESILENVEQIEKTGIRKSIMEGKNRLQKNYQIIKLTDRAEIPFMLEELKYNGERLKTNEVLVGIGLK
jgi:DNA polymerase-1